MSWSNSVRVDQPERRHHHAGRHRHPERPEDRAAVAQLDVQPAQRGDELPHGERRPHVLPGDALPVEECRRRIAHGRRKLVSDWLSARSPHKPEAVRADSRKWPAGGYLTVPPNRMSAARQPGAHRARGAEHVRHEQACPAHAPGDRHAILVRHVVADEHRGCVRAKARQRPSAPRPPGPCRRPSGRTSHAMCAASNWKRAASACCISSRNPACSGRACRGRQAKMQHERRGPCAPPATPGWAAASASAPLSQDGGSAGKVGTLQSATARRGAEGAPPCSPATAGTMPGNSASTCSTGRPVTMASAPPNARAQPLQRLALGPAAPRRRPAWRRSRAACRPGPAAAPLRAKGGSVSPINGRRRGGRRRRDVPACSRPAR